MYVNVVLHWFSPKECRSHSVLAAKHDTTASVRSRSLSSHTHIFSHTNSTRSRLPNVREGYFDYEHIYDIIDDGDDYNKGYIRDDEIVSQKCSSLVWCDHVIVTCCIVTTAV